MSTLHDALSGRWSSWSGLTERVTETQLDAALTAGRTGSREWARLSGQQVHTRRWHRDGRPSSVQAWFEARGDVALLLELAQPLTDTPLADLLVAWGPEDAWSPPRRFAPGASEELTYLRRGVSLTIGRSCDGVPDALLLAQVFPPTDLQGWVTRLGGHDQPGPG